VLETFFILQVFANKHSLHAIPRLDFERLPNSYCDSKGEAVSTWIPISQPPSASVDYHEVSANLLPPSWYAVTTRSQHERLVAKQLESQGITTLLPVIKEIHRWSDRRKIVEVPMFRGYLFVQCCMSPVFRRAILFARGVGNFVTMQGNPVPIPDLQIESIRKALTDEGNCFVHPFLKIGQPVRVRGVALDGLEGILTSLHNDRCVVISIDAIQRSLAVRIEGYDLEPA